MMHRCVAFVFHRADAGGWLWSGCKDGVPQTELESSSPGPRALEGQALEDTLRALAAGGPAL